MRINSSPPKWKIGIPVITVYLSVLLLCACNILESQTQSLSKSTSIPGNTPTSITYGGSHELNPDQVATLSSLKKFDDYPLYTMHYAGPYIKTLPTSGTNNYERLDPASPQSSSQWACSLFAALGNAKDLSFGRNFDWQFSPAVLLFTDPPDKLASVSMVDIAYLKFDQSQVRSLTELPLEDREPLLQAPYLPFDGMNEAGLAIGMAAVPTGNMAKDPKKNMIGSLEVMRQILDNAADIEQAVAILDSYNIDYGGGPPLHYLMADASGKAVLVEFYQGQMHLIRNETSWLSATNFLLSSVDEPRGQCRRFDEISERLSGVEGKLTQSKAMDLLSSVTQPNTQWSIIYHMTTGKIEIVMGGEFDNRHEFILNH